MLVESLRCVWLTQCEYLLYMRTSVTSTSYQNFISRIYSFLKWRTRFSVCTICSNSHGRFVISSSYNRATCFIAVYVLTSVNKLVNHVSITHIDLFRNKNTHFVFCLPGFAIFGWVNKIAMNWSGKKSFGSGPALNLSLKLLQEKSPKHTFRTAHVNDETNTLRLVCWSSKCIIICGQTDGDSDWVS